MHAAGLNTKKRSSQQNRLLNDGGGGGCDGGGILLHFAAAQRDVNVTKLTLCLFPAFKMQKHFAMVVYRIFVLKLKGGGSVAS